MALIYQTGNENVRFQGRGLIMSIECELTPPAIAIGNPNYYFNRFENFIERHPDCEHEPPDYYYGVLVNPDEEIDPVDLKELVGDTELPIYERVNGNKKPDPTQSYGHKYVTKFTNLRPKLTPAGQEWLDKTLKMLQKYLELGVVDFAYLSKYNKNFNKKNELNGDDNKLDIESAELFYTDIELNNDKFRSFAFATHPDAYDPLVMKKLPLQDLIKIIDTPEVKEFTKWDTWEQVGIMICELVPAELENGEISKATWEQLKKDYPKTTKIITDPIDKLNDKLNKLKSAWDKFEF